MYILQLLWGMFAIIWYTIKATIVDEGNAKPAVFGGLAVGMAALNAIGIIFLAMDIGKKRALDKPQSTVRELIWMRALLFCAICNMIGGAVLFVRDRAYNGKQDNEAGISDTVKDERLAQSMWGWTVLLIGSIFSWACLPEIFGLYDDAANKGENRSLISVNQF